MNTRSNPGVYIEQGTELVDHDCNLRIPIWIMKMMPVIRTKRSVEDGEHADDVRAFQIEAGTSKVVGEGGVDRTSIGHHLSI